MKSFTYIVMFLVGLSVVSCSKEAIKPSKDTDQSAAPVWRSANITGAVVLGDDDTSTNGVDVIDPKDRNNNLESFEGDDKGGEVLDPKDRKND